MKKKRVRPLDFAVGINPFNEDEILTNCIGNTPGYWPYIPLDVLLAIKEKLDATIEFAINNDINALNAECIRKRSLGLFNNKHNQPSANKKKTSIYLMIDHNTGLYKIGRSKSPLDREKTLQSEKPTIELIAHWKGVESHEKWLHSRYDEKRVRGEWFALTEKDVADILTSTKVNI